MIDEQRLAFQLELLVNADQATKPLAVCAVGHLVVAGNTHWQVERLTDLRSLQCRMVDACNA